MKRGLTTYLASLLVFIAMDFVWLSVTSARLYQAQLGGLLLAHPKMVPVLIFYPLYLVGLVALVVLPAARRKGWLNATAGGALFGAVAYGTYDLTNLATIAGFTLKVTIADMIWGMVISAVAATAGYGVARRVG